jgi:hypothetical protein
MPETGNSADSPSPRQKHAELALSDRPFSVLYRRYYENEYGHPPEEDPDVDR